MAVVTMRQLLEAGVHFGHQTRRWNPKMKRFIFGERNGIYIIDLNQTLERIDVAYSFVRDLVADNGNILFVGTKKQTQDPVARYAAQCGMPYVNERWLGGMLTNFNTIAGRVKKMQEYERMRDAGDFEAMPKKEALILSRELDKLQRNLGGIRNMTKLPEAVFIIDTKKEHIAVTEANKLGLPIVAVVDTNCDPDLITFVIPGNDDAIRAGTLLCRVIADAVEEGRFIASRRAARAGSPAAGGPPVIDAEEETRRAEQQRDARRQAALAQAEREARLASGRRTAGDDQATADAPVASGTAAAPAEAPAAPAEAPVAPAEAPAAVETAAAIAPAGPGESTAAGDPPGAAAADDTAAAAPADPTPVTAAAEGGASGSTTEE
jgi:small subunit ribosomal protein S2